jgi:SAM-dependent methyltransferase
MDLMRENQADLLESNFSSVADSYDELPYDDRPIFRTHPGRMAANARLFGMNPPPVETARVLELGCAAGANIIPLAVFYPGAEFVGIDLGRRQIEDGVRRISGLGLANIELRCESITDLPHDAGSFDYIICHGVYSWVPEPVREAILALCRRHLSPNGVAYVSYNVLPGWRAMQPLRDALRALVPKDASIADRARLGRRLASYLAQMTPDRTPYGAMLQQLPRHIGNRATPTCSTNTWRT